MSNLPGEIITTMTKFVAKRIAEASFTEDELLSAMLNTDDTTGQCLTLSRPAVDAHAPELLAAASKWLEMRLPTIALLSRQARARRGRIYFRYLRAAWKSLLRDQDGIAGICGKDGDWAGYLHTRWHCLCIHGHLAALSFSGLRYLLWSQQGARGVRRMRYHAARISKLSMQA